VTQAPRQQGSEACRAKTRRSAVAQCLAAGVLLLASGCATSWNPFKRPDPPAPTGDGLVLRAGKLEKDSKPAPGTAGAELEAAKELYQKNEYAKAEKLFAKVAEDKKAKAQFQEEGRYFEGDCQRLQAHYPSAVATFKRQLKDFPSGAYQRKALQQMFDIANYWLDETREVMKARAEQKEGKRTLVMPVSFVHIDKTKPLFDLEGHAVATLEQVYLNDPTGPLGERALWYVGCVRYYHEDYLDADYYFGQIVKNYPNGEFAPKALELSIICKQMATGGPEYDGRKLAEARKLVDTAKSSYPELASQKSEFLYRQLATINLQQAAKDYEVARFYDRIRHPGSAYFCYEIVRRRYPGTRYAEAATKRMDVLRVQAEKELGKTAAKTQAPAGGPAPPVFPTGPSPTAGPLPTAPNQMLGLLPPTLAPGAGPVR
jgi:outer membrane protein assembly factor BamD (BamD/ComL family)